MDEEPVVWREEAEHIQKLMSTKLSRCLILFFFKLSAIQVNIFFLLVQELPSVSLNFTPKVLHFCLFSLSYKITGFEHVFASWLFPVSLAGLALVQLACCLLMLDLHPSNVLSRA